MKNTENKNMTLIEQPNEETIVSINESTYYAYYSTLLMLLETGDNVKNVRLFRYKSLGENALWQDLLKDTSNKRVLFLYALFDEVSALINWYTKNIPDKNKVEKSKELAFITRVAIMGYMASRILKEGFFEAFKNFGPAGEAFRSFIALGNSLGESGRLSFFWNENIGEDLAEKDTLKDMNMYMHSIVKIFKESDFLSNKGKHVKEISSLLEIIKKEDFINRFFSIKEAIFANIIDHTKAEEEISKYIVFLKRAPLWVDTSENNSFFSFLFIDLLDDTTKEYVLTLEYLRVFLSVGKSERKNIRDSSFLYMVKLMMDANNKKFSKFDDDFKELSSILLSGGDISDQRAFFAYLHNKKTIELYRKEIMQLVDFEGAEISIQIKKTVEKNSPNTQEEIKELTKLFFINIFRKIEEFLSESGGIIYEELNEKDKARLSLLLSSIIKGRIPKTIKLGGVFDE